MLTPEDRKYVLEMLRECAEPLTDKEATWLWHRTFGGLSGAAAARKAGYRSPAASARQLAARPHVHDLLLLFRELAAEAIRDAEEAPRCP